MQHAEITQRREIEDEALELGRERNELQRALATNRRAMSALLHRATAAGIPVEQFARLVGVTRASLYRWQHAKETNE